MRRQSCANSVLIGLAVLFLMASWAVSVSSYAADKMPPKPKSLSVASYEVGGAMHIICAALGEGIYKKFGVRLRTLPVGTGSSRILNVRLGNADFAVTSDSLFASEGIYDYANLDWGPQPLRTIYVSNRQSAYSFVVAADSGIKSIADLKGKRIGWPVGSPFTQLWIIGSLAFANLTLDDVKLVEVRSMAQMYDMVVDGKTDCAPYDSLSSVAYRFAASPKGLYWIPFPIEDKEGWARFKAVLPEVQPVLCKYGPNLDNNPTWLPTVPFPQYVTYANADEGKVYWITKMIAESFDEYKDITPAMPWHQLDEAIKPTVVLPYHPGAVRYFKERGVWNAQKVKNQTELLDRQTKLGNFWKAAIIEGADKAVKAGDFPDFWSKKREKEFPKFWVETQAKAPVKKEARK